MEWLKGSGREVFVSAYEEECVRCERRLCVDINRQGPAVTLRLNGLAGHMPTTSGPTSLPLCVCASVRYRHKFK